MPLASGEPSAEAALSAEDALVFVSWLLRVCVAMTFLGHGVLAVQIQGGWFAYLRVVGIGTKIGAPLMQIIGVMDIIVAVLALFPLPSVHAWAALWGLATALMRPLAGESIHQLIERSGNFLPALTLLFIETREAKVGFEQWLAIIGGLGAVGVMACLLLRSTGIFAADRPDRAAVKKA